MCVWFPYVINLDCFKFVFLVFTSSSLCSPPWLLPFPRFPPSPPHPSLFPEWFTNLFLFFFFFIKIGTNTASVSDEITAISKLAEDSPLSTTLHSAGTTIAGPWNEVMDLIGQMHELLHNKHDVLRIQSDIRVGTRVDKLQTPADKIDVVKRKLKALLGTD